MTEKWGQICILAVKFLIKVKFELRIFACFLWDHRPQKQSKEIVNWKGKNVMKRALTSDVVVK